MKRLIFLLLFSSAAHAQNTDTLFRKNEECGKLYVLDKPENWRPHVLIDTVKWDPHTNLYVIDSLKKSRVYFCRMVDEATCVLVLFNGKEWLLREVGQGMGLYSDISLDTAEIDGRPGAEIVLRWTYRWSHTCAMYANEDQKKYLTILDPKSCDVLLHIAIASDTRYSDSETPNDPSWCSRRYTVRMGPGWISCYRRPDRGSVDRYTFAAPDCGCTLPEGTFTWRGNTWVRLKNRQD
ncbi:MAG: hypothetical protein FD123_1033 [Bacteroidetes bacterium]|nr:MAG: hypothetical protein FD123_1033 [Bacteroidota bacterium]